MFGRCCSIRPSCHEPSMRSSMQFPFALALKPDIMAVRTFAMSKSLNEALSTFQPPSSTTDFSLTENAQQNHSNPRPEPVPFQEPNPQTGIMFAGQHKLPKLPIPDLESTCKKYLDALKPLQNEHEHEDTEGAVHDFLRNEGPELQARLKKYAAGKTSYIEQFCTLIMLHQHWIRDWSQFAVSP